jgi:CubicO group peptidase (beta-lactamase class C family)
MSEPAAAPSAIFDRIGDDALAGGKAPGFSLVVVHGDEIVYARGFGLADVKRGIAVEPQTRFAIGSITKQFTAASILLLAARGKLGLDDTVAKFDPTYPNASRITLRMLLNQTSGLHNYPTPGEHAWPWAGPLPIRKLLAILATDKPDFDPGTRWEYSNANYALLSGILEQADGIDEGAFLERNIFGPLKMSASGYGNAAQRAAVATPYAGTTTPNAPKPTDFLVQDGVGLDIYAGAGAIVSTAPDLAKWDLALMRGTLLDAAATHALWSAGSLANGTPVNYAMGFVPATLAGHREVWHNGLAPGAGGYCYNAIFPDDGLAVIILSNGYDFRGVPERMVVRVLAAYDPKAGALLAPATAPSPAPGEDPAVTARAKEWYHRLQTGTVDLTQATPAFAARLTPDLLAQIHAGMAGTSEPTDWIYLGARSANGVTISTYWIRIDGAVHTWSIGLTHDGKIALSGLQ